MMSFCKKGCQCVVLEEMTDFILMQLLNMRAF